MSRTPLIRVAAAFVALTAGFAVATATYTEGYYDRMDGKSKESLKTAAKQSVQSHTRLDYYSLPAYWQYTDIYPETVDGSRRWWEMYSDAIYLIRPGQSPNSSFSANKMQREHSVPKSWWKKNNDVEYTPAYTDMWNLYPSDGPANQSKSNYPFGEVSGTPTFDNGVTKVGAPSAGLGGGSSKVFEPGDEYKGDFARTIFYMATVYDDLPWVINYMFTANSPYPTLRPWAVDMLLQWARQDPVSQKERDRNDGVESQQGNRNPFIDFPELAEYIWGTRMQETFYIADQGGSVTPPITGDPEITAPVNGEALDFGQAAVTTVVSRVLEIRGGNLTSALSLSLSGSDRKMFELSQTSLSPSQINASGLYLLNVYYKPTAVGRHQAALVLYDGGLPDGQSIAVDLSAEALPVPELSRLTALGPTDLTPTQYTAQWTAAPEVVDYYLLERTVYHDGNEESDLLESVTNSLTVTGRNPEATESYRVMSVRLGFKSEPSNTILVEADSGVAQAADPFPTRWEAEEGGIRLYRRCGWTDVDICDVNGTLIFSGRCQDGDLLPLPAHRVLIMRASGLRVPVKILL